MENRVAPCPFGRRNQVSNPENLHLILSAVPDVSCIRFREVANLLLWEAITVRQILDWALRKGYLKQLTHHMFRLQRLPALPLQPAADTRLIPQPKPS